MQRVNSGLANLMAEAKADTQRLDIALNVDQKDAEEFRKTLFLNFLHPDIQEKLVEYLDLKYAGYLSQLSVFATTLDRKLAHQIVLTVQQGNLTQTEDFIKERPQFSSAKGTAMDYSRRTISNVTPFQAALCALDKEMCEMLKKYMNPEEATRQYHEVFPEGHEKYFASQTPFDFGVLLEVITQSSEAELEAALAKQQNDSRLCQTLNQFRVAFTDRSQQEKVFNPQHLIKVLQLHEENFDRWNWNQRDLFWRQVIGYVQRFLPANIAQDVAEGLYYLVINNQNSRRSFNFTCGGGSMFPLDFNSHSGLGFDYAGTDWGEKEKRQEVSTVLTFVRRRFKQKQCLLENASNIETQRDETRRAGCLIQ